MTRFALVTFLASAILSVVAALAGATTEPRAATTLTIVNRRAVTAVTLTVITETETVKHSGPLASNAKVSLTLPEMRGCLITVAATFQDGSFTNDSDTDVCKVKLVRLID